MNQVDSTTMVLTGGSPTESWATEYSGLLEEEVQNADSQQHFFLSHHSDSLDLFPQPGHCEVFAWALRWQVRPVLSLKESSGASKNPKSPINFTSEKSYLSPGWFKNPLFGSVIDHPKN